jgi:hypothetical protein
MCELIDRAGKDDIESIDRLKRGDIGGLELLIARHQLKAIRAAILITYNQHFK